MCNNQTASSKGIQLQSNFSDNLNEYSNYISYKTNVKQINYTSVDRYKYMWGISITGSLINTSINNISIDSIYPAQYR